MLRGTKRVRHHDGKITKNLLKYQIISPIFFYQEKLYRYVYIKFTSLECNHIDRLSSITHSL